MLKADAIKYIQEKVKDGEPVFILRAQDKFFASTIRMWESMVRNGRPHSDPQNDPKLREALELADAGERWGNEQGSKIPD